MTEIDLANKRLDYWMRELGLYDHCECLSAAQTHPKLAAVLKRLGYKIPRKPIILPPIKYIEATDDWYPTYRDHMVAIRWYSKSNSISVWGADDFGMCKTDTNITEYNELVALGSVSKALLKARGFYPI
jgi:hypothetical protein